MKTRAEYWTAERIAEFEREAARAEREAATCSCGRDGCKHERAAEAAWAYLHGAYADAGLND